MEAENKKSVGATSLLPMEDSALRLEHSCNAPHGGWRGGGRFPLQGRTPPLKKVDSCKGQRTSEVPAVNSSGGQQADRSGLREGGVGWGEG